MAKSLAEYAAQNPQEMPPQERTARAEAKTIADRRQEWQEAERLKDSIARQIESGTAPQTILYTALSCIGLLTTDKEWTEATQTGLDTVYADLAQLSLLEDNAALERERLQKMQTEYSEKLRQDVRRKINGLNKVQRALYAVLDAVEEIDPENPLEPDKT